MQRSFKYKLSYQAVKSSIEAWEYYLNDVLESTYMKADVSVNIKPILLHFSPSYLKQDAVGDEIGGKFDTVQYGLNAGISFKGGDLTFYFADTPDDGVFAPWGDGKAIIQQINASGRANEKAYAAKASYNFKEVGINGLEGYVFYGKYNTPESGRFASPDINETNFSLQYTFDEKSELKGLSLRVRYAIIDQKGAEDYDDFRIYIKYTFAIKG